MIVLRIIGVIIGGSAILRLGETCDPKCGGVSGGRSSTLTSLLDKST
jgi:hypothetical protein